MVSVSPQNYAVVAVRFVDDSLHAPCFGSTVDIPQPGALRGRTLSLLLDQDPREHTASVVAAAIKRR